MQTHKTGWDVFYLAFEVMAKLFALALIILAVWITLAVYDLTDEAGRNSGTNAAYRAMRDTGIQVSEENGFISSALHYDTYARDGDETVIFQVRYDRQTLWETIQNTPGWQEAQISAEDYTALARAEFWGPNDVTAPAADIVFDAWFYRDDYKQKYGGYADGNLKYKGLPEAFGLNGQPDTLNATFAFYDRETGAFFYHSYDT